MRHYKDCSNIYLSVRKKMETAFTEPRAFPDHSQLRMVDMYSGVARILDRGCL